MPTKFFQHLELPQIHSSTMLSAPNKSVGSTSCWIHWPQKILNTLQTSLWHFPNCQPTQSLVLGFPWIHLKTEDGPVNYSSFKSKENHNQTPVNPLNGGFDSTPCITSIGEILLEMIPDNGFVVWQMNTCSFCCSPDKIIFQ